MTLAALLKSQCLKWRVISKTGHKQVRGEDVTRISSVRWSKPAIFMIFRVLSENHSFLRKYCHTAGFWHWFHDKTVISWHTRTLLKTRENKHGNVINTGKHGNVINTGKPTSFQWISWYFRRFSMIFNEFHDIWTRTVVTVLHHGPHLPPHHHYPGTTHHAHGGSLPVHPGTHAVSVVTVGSPGSFWLQRVSQTPRSSWFIPPFSSENHHFDSFSVFILSLWPVTIVKTVIISHKTRKMVKKLWLLVIKHGN